MGSQLTSAARTKKRKIWARIVYRRVLILSSPTKFLRLEGWGCATLGPLSSAEPLSGSRGGKARMPKKIPGVAGAKKGGRQPKATAVGPPAMNPATIPDAVPEP